MHKTDLAGTSLLSKSIAAEAAKTNSQSPQDHKFVIVFGLAPLWHFFGDLKCKGAPGKNQFDLPIANLFIACCNYEVKHVS